jgi:hypothetical protein
MVRTSLYLPAMVSPGRGRVGLTRERRRELSFFDAEGAPERDIRAPENGTGPAAG